MTPEQKIKHAILAKVAVWENKSMPEVTDENIDDLYQLLVDEGGHWDAKNEVRTGQLETDIPCEWSRHYESKSVASMMPDGSWVGWTYWFGGGKYGEPEGVPWMEDAYDLTCEEKQ